MKNQIRNYRGVALSLVVTLFTITLLSFSAQAWVILIDGPTITNANVAYNAYTNVGGITTNNYQNGQVPGASNVMYELNTSYGAQTGKGTNGFLPAFVLSMRGGFPGALTGPSKNVSIEISGQLMGTNATSTAVTVQFAKTDSGKAWLTNCATALLTFPVNSTSTATGCYMTNIDTGGDGFLALQQINNPGVAALTNIVIELSSKPGL